MQNIGKLGENTQKFFDMLQKQNQNSDTPQTIIKDQGIDKYRELAASFYGKHSFVESIPEISFEETSITYNDTQKEAVKLKLKIFRNNKLAADKRPALIFFAGGASILNLEKPYDHPLSTIAQYAGIDVIRVYTRLAPEYTRLQAFEDAFFAVKNIFDNAVTYKLDKSQIAIGGNSSGSHLAALVTNKVRDVEDFTIKAQLFIGLSADLTRPKTKYHKYEIKDIMLQPEVIKYFTQISLPQDINCQGPTISPYYDELANLPKTIFIFGEFDGLRGDSEKYIEKMQQYPSNSGKVIFHCLPGQVHASMLLHKTIPDGLYQAEVAGTELQKILNPNYQFIAQTNSQKINDENKSKKYDNKISSGL